ncbi:MAG: oxidoreductase [Alphaproteobacteria bacterium]|nr:MAG: oxidoreductase [Alphaproteobacteria bacterium]
MTDLFNAIVAEEIDGRVQGRLKQISLADLPDEDVLVDVAYSTLNYKDGLAVTGKGKICRKLPMVCGIDLAGTVAESRDDRFKPGDRVLVNGYGLSERHWGGYSQRQRVNPDFLLPIPDAFLPEEAMAIGTAGYTAMLCVQAIADHGIGPDAGPVLVTGASGGVGSIAVMLLDKLGYEVVAASGRAKDNQEFLRGLGAAEVIDRDELARDPKPLESERWAAAVDVVGGQVLSTVIAETRYEGLVAACGLAGGVGLNSTVMPFILRGVTLRGIDSVMASMERRRRAWSALADLIDKHKLREDYTVEPMSRVPELAEQILEGRIRGRVVIDVNA